MSAVRRAAALSGMTEVTTFSGATLPISADGDTITLGDGLARVVVPDIETANATVDHRQRDGAPHAGSHRLTGPTR